MKGGGTGGGGRPEPPLLGAHVSAAGGLWRAPGRADRIGARAMQIFTRGPQRWEQPPLDDEEAEAFRVALAASRVRFAAAHDSYLINLASPDRRLRRRSAAAFRAELERCVRLGLDCLVTHPGNATDGRRRAGLRRNAEAVAAALAAVPGRTIVLFETTAGCGSALGARFEELAALVDGIPTAERRRIGVCLDTCHVFAAGYDLSEGAPAVLDELERIVGPDRLRLVHLNDSVGGLGSRRDRHAHIGEGRLGRRAFASLLADRRLAGLPAVLETPKDGNAARADRRNLARLRRLARPGRSPARSGR